MNRKSFVVAVLTVLIMATGAVAQEHQHEGMNHHDEMNKRGDKGMGFDQVKTTHHFRLFTDGGAIEVSANDAGDTTSRNQIRSHLKHIAMLFSDGNFSIPMFVHDQVPPGVETMKQQKTAISYKYEETEHGGRVRITTSSAQALTAIHEFLRFQIQEHQTSDTQEVTKSM